jgi:hypothetical protein
MTTTVSNVAEIAEKVVTSAHEVAPFAEKVLMLFPGFGPSASMAVEMADSLVPDILNALQKLMADNGGNIITARAALAAHINPDMPNLPALGR